MSTLSSVQWPVGMAIKGAGRTMRSGNKEPNPNFIPKKRRRNGKCARWKHSVGRTWHLKNKTLSRKIRFPLAVPEWPACLLTQEREDRLSREALCSPPLGMPSGRLAPPQGLCVTNGHVSVLLVCWVALDHHVTTEAQKRQAFQKKYKCMLMPLTVYF